MQAIIMAAGKGTRISQLIDGKPKCTVDIGGITLIEDTIDKLHTQGINKIAVVLGFQAKLVRSLLSGMEITIVDNPFYDITNSIASLWFAKDLLLNDDFLLMNGDVYLEKALLAQILQADVSPVMFADETRKEQADYKFYYEHGRLIKYGKHLMEDEISGEYIGIAKLHENFIPIFKQRIELLISNQQHQLWWEDVLYSLSKDMNIYVRDVNGLFWAEVDYFNDYQRIVEYRKTHITDY